MDIIILNIYTGEHYFFFFPFLLALLGSCLIRYFASTLPRIPSMADLELTSLVTKGE